MKSGGKASCTRYSLSPKGTPKGHHLLQECVREREREGGRERERERGRERERERQRETEAMVHLGTRYRLLPRAAMSMSRSLGDLGFMGKMCNHG